MHVFNEKTNVHVFVRVRVLLMLEGSYKLFLNHTRVSQHLFIHLLSLGLYPVPENSKFRLVLQMSYLTIDNIGRKNLQKDVYEDFRRVADECERQVDAGEKRV